MVVLCQCDCGNQITVDGQSLRVGRTRSCGCLCSETAKQNAQRNRSFKLEQGNINALMDDNGVFLNSVRKSKRNHTGILGVSFDKQSGRYLA
jgi:hypothetical protein